ncbi:peptidase M24, partial [Vararia minispora EC-137]
ASLRTHCAHTSPIPRSDFLARQQSLAETLHAFNASAYIAEPGASAGYFANLAGASWHLSERPLLLVVAPALAPDGSVSPRVTVVTPAFEATRAKGLPLAAAGVTWAQWAEDADPYAAAVAAAAPGGRPIFVDDMVRHFVVAGLQKAAGKDSDVVVESAPVGVRQLRERKSARELGLLQCANEATLLAIRAVKDKMRFGMRESEARALVDSALSAAGLTDHDVLVMFGENAALPHGSGTDKALSVNDFVLIDCGGALHGYKSDVTRTFALPGSQLSATQRKLWDVVHEAQSRALAAATVGAPAASVDAAAREHIVAEGYGKYFTHRLGHGIGLETHEAPYLRGGSLDVLQPGHTFSDEPGIYIEGSVGVRLEDCFYVQAEAGRAGRLFTEGVGGQAADPWNP